MTDVLAISHACVTAINRLPFSRLAAKGWNLEILVPSTLAVGSGEQRPDPGRPGDPPLHFLPPTSNHPRRYTLRNLQELLEALRPRLVLIDGDPASRLSLEVGRWAGKRDASLVCQSCENLSRRLSASWRRAGLRGLLSASVIRTLSWLAGRRVSQVLVISEDGRRAFEEMGYADRITKIPLGFDPEIFTPDVSRREETRRMLGLEDLTIAYFGRMTEEKGIHVLLQALARMKSLKWQLLLDEFSDYASGYQSYLKSLIEEHGLGSRTVYFDASHEEMPAYMNAADIVVVPSITRPFWKEQYGRIAPEAMACGRAVVVSDSGTLPELAGDAAVVVPESDVESLVRAIEDLATSPEKRLRLGEKARERAHRYLSVDQQVEIMDGLFRELIGEPGGA